MDAKKLLLETLDFYKYKVEHNLCTPEEMKSVLRAIEENVEMNASIDEIADFYNNTSQNVRTVISRKMFAKPKRKVLYPFHLFQKIVPDKWRKDK